MKIRDDYPIYVNPDFEEILELAESKWDTCRIMESEEYLCIASGYGNTHNSIVTYTRQLLKKKEMFSLCSFILFHEQGICYVNGDGHLPYKDDRRVRLQSALKYFSANSIPMLKDLARESGLSI